MRKISLVAAIALMLAGVGVWATSTTQARIDVPAGAQINPLQITMGARNMEKYHEEAYCYSRVGHADSAPTFAQSANAAPMSPASSSFGSNGY